MTTALVASGLPPHPFRFVGFLPRTAAAPAALEAVGGDGATLVVFEAPRRVTDALRDALAVPRRSTRLLGANVTKPGERYQRGPTPKLIAALETEDQVRGECHASHRWSDRRAGGRASRGVRCPPPVAHGAPARAVQELLVATPRHEPKRDAYALRPRAAGAK